MLSAWSTDWDRTPPHKLEAVFAGMVGQTYRDVTIESGATYSLNLDGTLERVS